MKIAKKTKGKYSAKKGRKVLYNSGQNLKQIQETVKRREHKNIQIKSIT